MNPWRGLKSVFVKERHNFNFLSGLIG